MDRARPWFAGAMAAVSLSAGTLILTAGTAAAQGCSAGPQQACVAVSYQNTTAQSIRVNGRCLIGGSGYHPDVTVDWFTTPDVQAYGGRHCEGGTSVPASIGWGSRGGDGYRWVSVRPGGPGCGVNSQVQTIRPDCILSVQN